MQYSKKTKNKAQTFLLMTSVYCLLLRYTTTHPKYEAISVLKQEKVLLINLFYKLESAHDNAVVKLSPLRVTKELLSTLFMGMARFQQVVKQRKFAWLV